MDVCCWCNLALYTALLLFAVLLRPERLLERGHRSRKVAHALLVLFLGGRTAWAAIILRQLAGRSLAMPLSPFEFALDTGSSIAFSVTTALGADPKRRTVPHVHTPTSL